jgi:cryptochrome
MRTGPIRLTATKPKSTLSNQFEKPKTSPAAFSPASTTVLSPHLKFGSLSCRTFYHFLQDTLAKAPGPHSQPPVSLTGQLLWREFYYAVASCTPNYGQMRGNPICLQVPWWCAEKGGADAGNPQSAAHLQAWREGRTGYPWIDAIMRQLQQEGWIHHLARHSVACFLTRGDLFISWERGVEVFDELLLDADWALNNGRA